MKLAQCRCCGKEFQKSKNAGGYYRVTCSPQCAHKLASSKWRPIEPIPEPDELERRKAVIRENNTRRMRGEEPLVLDWLEGGAA